MGLFKTTGIIIKQINYDEADKILTILTKDHGKIQALAKGARKTNNRFLASTQLFCYSNFIFYQGKSMNYINQAELRESFYNLRKNLKDFTYASYIIELINAATQEQQKEEKYFFLLIHTLKHMTYTKEIDLDIITLAFQVKLMALSGYAPHLDDCVVCGNSIQYNMKISSELGGVICPQCFQQDSYAMGINKDAKEVLSFILHKPLSNLNQLVKKDSIIRQLNKIMYNYVSKYMERSFHTLNFLNIIDNNILNNKGNKNKGDEKNG